jgi:hypothetical protein
MRYRREGEFFAKPASGYKRFDRLSHLKPKSESMPLPLNELSKGVNALAGSYPDDASLTDLRIPPSSLSKANYEAYGFSLNCNPPEDWAEFYNKLESTRKKYLSTAMDKAVRAGFTSVGEIRKATIEEMLAPKAHGSSKPRLNEKSALFLKKCFEVQENKAADNNAS